MRYLKLYELHKSHKFIKEICQKYNIENYTINLDGSIDVSGDVDLRGKKYGQTIHGGRKFEKKNNWTLTEIPITFRNVSGVFDIRYNDIKSLKGSPITCDEYYISNNKIECLDGSPRSVGRFLGGNNPLKSLENGPLICYGDYNVQNCKLTSLKGCPKEIKGYIDFGSNDIHTLDHLSKLIDKEHNPLTGETDQTIYMNDTPIKKLIEIFIDPNIVRQNNITISKLKRFFQSLDYYYLRDNVIVRGRFISACEELDIEVPSSIDGYTFL